MQTYRTIILAFLITLLSGCSLLDENINEAPLRRKYSEETADSTLGGLYANAVLVNVGVGAVSQAIPAVHLIGLIVDVAVMYSYLDVLIYGTGAIIARDSNCPELLETKDYWGVLGAWFQGIRTTSEFNAAMSLAGTLIPSTSRAQALQLFATAMHTYGAKLVGVKLAGVIVAKITAKGLAGFIPVLGPIAAAGINWYILSGVNDAARAYYTAKANHACLR